MAAWIRAAFSQWAVAGFVGLVAYTMTTAYARPTDRPATDERIEITLTPDGQTTAGIELEFRTGAFEIGERTYLAEVELADSDRLRSRFRFASTTGPVRSRLSAWLPLYAEVTLSGQSFEIFSLSRDLSKLVLHKRSFAMRAPNAPNPGESAPPIRAFTLAGDLFNLDDYRGKHVLLDFWGTWCSPCLEDTPRPEAMFVRYGKDLVVVGIANDTAENVARYLESRPVPIPQIIQESSSDSVLAAYGVLQYPSYYLIDPAGVVVSRNVNQLRGDNLIRNMQLLLQ